MGGGGVSGSRVGKMSDNDILHFLSRTKRQMSANWEGLITWSRDGFRSVGLILITKFGLLSSTFGWCLNTNKLSFYGQKQRFVSTNSLLTHLIAIMICFLLCM